MNEDNKRLFFGYSIEAPWPLNYPKGRVIDENSRHITLAFLGNHPFSQLEKNLVNFPHPHFLIGPVGKCDRILFLPKHKPRVVANHLLWFSQEEKTKELHTEILNWLEKLNYPIDRRPMMSHISVARGPFEEQEWEKAFRELPFIVTGIHLYESIGNLCYSSIWEFPLLPAFEEFEHTADIAFHVRGTTFQELYLHGAIAMSFQFPPFLRFLEETLISNVDQVVQQLNKMLTRCDLEMGCPFKAVSYHSQLEEEKNGILHWEMIIDV